MRAMSGGSGQTSLLVSMSGFSGCWDASFFFFSLPAIALGVTESITAARTTHEIDVISLWVELSFIANITALLQSFLCDRCRRTAFPASYLWPAGLVLRPHAAGGSSSN